MLKIKDEEFVDIKNYDGRYKIGNKGTVIGVSRSKDERYKHKQWILKQYEDKNEYEYADIVEMEWGKEPRIVSSENFEYEKGKTIVKRLIK